MSDEKERRVPQSFDPDRVTVLRERKAAEEAFHGPVEIPPDARFTPAETPESSAGELVPADVPRAAPWGRRFAAALAAALGAYMLWEIYALLAWAFERSWLLGTLVAVLLGAVAVTGARFLLREWRGLRQLRELERLREQARAAQASDSGAMQQFLAELQARCRNTRLAGEIGAFARELDPTYSDTEVMELLSTQVLGRVDGEALRLITRRSIESAVLVGSSPFVSLDTLLLGMRSYALVNEVARVYGLQPGFAGRVALLKRALYNLAFVGVTEMAIDSGTEVFGASLTSVLSARIGQGLGAGILTARFGLQAMEACRPVPFPPGRRPRLGAIRGEILSELRKLLPGSAR